MEHTDSTSLGGEGLTGPDLARIGRIVGLRRSVRTLFRVSRRSVGSEESSMRGTFMMPGGVWPLEFCVGGASNRQHGLVLLGLIQGSCSDLLGSVTRVHAIKADDESMSELDFSEDTACSIAVGPEGSPTPVPSSEATLDSLYLGAKGGRGTPGTGTPSSTDNTEESEDLKDSVEDWNLRKVSPLTPKVLWCDGNEHQRNRPKTSSQSPQNSRGMKKLNQAGSTEGDLPARCPPTLDRSSRNHSPRNTAKVVVPDTLNSTPVLRRLAKVDMCDSEKQFILSLSEVPPESEGVPPLLGDEPPPERYGPLAGPYAAVIEADDPGTCVVPLGPKKTLVLDLDETLVASTRTPVSCDFKVVFRIQSRTPGQVRGVVGEKKDKDMHKEKDTDENGGCEGGKTKAVANESLEDEHDKPSEICYYVRLRPGVREFLEKVAELFELVVWTASGKAYADAILDLLDPKGNLFSQRLYREACVRHRGLCVKDLRRLGRPMNSVVLLDNFIYSFGFTLDNGLPIVPWTGVEGENESGLLGATELLYQLAQAPDVRSPLIKVFDLYRRVHGERPTCVSPRVFPLPAAVESGGTRRSRHASRGRSGCLSPGRTRWISGNSDRVLDCAGARTPKGRQSPTGSCRGRVHSPSRKEYEPLLADCDDQLME